MASLPGGAGVLVASHVPVGRQLEDVVATHRTADSAAEALVREGFGFALILPDRVGLFADWTCRRRLYYAAGSEGQLDVADTLDAFPGRAVDRGLLRLTLSFRFVPPPFTPLQGVRKVAAGSTVWIDRPTGRAGRPTYYLGAELAAEAPAPNGGLQAVLDTSLAGAAGPTTVFLSGGFDSTLLAARARAKGRIDTAYTVTYDTHIGRLSHAEAVASAGHLGLALHTLTLDRETFGRAIDDALDAVDEPFADVATVPECALARVARAAGLEYAIEGEGADSCFGGSYKFIAERYARWLRPLARLGGVLGVLPQNRRGALTTMLMKAHTLARALGERPGFERTFGFLQGAIPGGADEIAGWDEIVESYRALYALGQDPINAMAAATFWGVIPYLENRKLEAVERVSGMRLSAPFLDPAIVRRAFAMPGAAKIRYGYGKYPLRREFGAQLPPHVAARRKLSFVPPVGDWIIDLHEPTLRSGRVVMPEAVDGLIRAHQAGWRDHTALLWGIYCVERWAANRPAS